MVYSLIRVPGGFKIKSESGSLLSNKPLTKKKATLSSIKSGDIRPKK